MLSHLYIQTATIRLHIANSISILKTPPPYECLVWDYNKANVESIKNSIDSVNWEVMFINKSIHKQVSIFNKTLMNIFSNFTPNKLVTFGNKNPPWMKDYVKGKIKWKNQLYKIYAKNGYNCNDYFQLQEATNVVFQLVSNRKQEYYNDIALKLNNPKTSAKTYWSILKTFYNGKKISVIPPLLINHKLVSNFKTKANHFNVLHCTPLDNNSKIPGNQTYVADNKLSSLHFEDSDIIKIIRSLDTSKAHGHNSVSFRILKICDSALIKPLWISSRNCISQSIFPDMEEIHYSSYS